MSHNLRRSEIVFLYDVYNANPNGDPLEDNRPRIDPVTNRCLVTDVRIKRTIRDYLKEVKGIDIFVFPEITDKGLKTKEEKLEEFLGKKEDITKEDIKMIIDQFFDLRVFGATIAVKDNPISFVGPVQFSIAESLHEVEVIRVMGTTVMPSKAGKMAGTFTEKYMIRYGLINSYGVLDNRRAEITGMSSQDFDLVLEGLWYGTKLLATTSKLQHNPRLLIVVEYSGDYIAGGLNRLVTVKADVNEREIRDISHIKVDLSKLIRKLSDNKVLNRIVRIRVSVDDDITLIIDNEVYGSREFINRLRDIFGDKLEILQFH